MSGESAYISVGGKQLHYLRWGSGSKVLLAFHGYGNDGSVFAPCAAYLSEEYRILSFDLPYHGQTAWPAGAMLGKEEVAALVVAVKESCKVDKVSLMGYSMGGRVCMSILEYMPGVVDRMVLIATDGLSVNRLYYFCTRTFIGRRLFRHVLRDPARYFKLVEWLRNTNRLDPTRYRFVMQHLQAPESRGYIRQVWQGMSALIPSPSKLKRLIRSYKVPVFIFMGAHDRIMPPALAAKFGRGLDTVKLKILDRGHRVFDKENAGQITECLL